MLHSTVTCSGGQHCQQLADIEVFLKGRIVQGLLLDVLNKLATIVRVDCIRIHNPSTVLSQSKLLFPKIIEHRMAA